MTAGCWPMLLAGARQAAACHLLPAAQSMRLAVYCLFFLMRSGQCAALCSPILMILPYLNALPCPAPAPPACRPQAVLGSSALTMGLLPPHLPPPHSAHSLRTALPQPWAHRTAPLAPAAATTQSAAAKHRWSPQMARCASCRCSTMACRWVLEAEWSAGVGWVMLGMGHVQSADRASLTFTSVNSSLPPPPCLCL